MDQGGKWKKEAKNTEESCKTMASAANIHELYEASVQSPTREVANLLMMHRKTYKSDSRRYSAPSSLREDFCGTALLSKTWIDKGVSHIAVGIDWDPSIIEYSKKVHFSDQYVGRVHLYCANVLEHNPEYKAVDILASLSPNSAQAQTDQKR